MSRILLACWAAALLSSAAHAQTVRPGSGRGKVHRMEIYNGITQSVRYYGNGLTPGEASTLRDLERVENESIYARNLIALKQQYVSGERVLDAYRRSVQLQLYGQDITQSQFGAVAYGGYGYGGVGLGYGYTNAGFGRRGAVAGYDRTTNYSLENGVGYEGAIKDAVARTIAVQATPEYLASLERAYDRVAIRASVSPILRVAFDLPSPEEGRKERERIRAVAGEADAPAQASAPVTLTLKDGEKLVGKKVTENGNWIVLERVDGGRVRIRAGEVTRIDEAAPGGKVRPAVD